MSKGGLAKRLINMIQSFVGHLTGGLAIASVVTCMFFSAISGSATATVSSIGGFMIPEIKKRGYETGFCASLVSCAGSLGLFIPPSLSLVFYGVVTSSSISDLFIATIIPGIIVTLVLCIVAWFLSKKYGYPKERKCSWRERGRAVWDAKWAIICPVIILGGIYGGIFTATEAGGIACVYALVVGVFIYKGIKTRKQAFDIFYETGYSIGTILMIFPMTLIFSRLLVMNGVPEMVTNFMMGISVNRYVILLLLDILLVLAGFFLDCNVLLLVLTPLLLPTATAIGLSQIHLATIIFVAIGLGGMTPPMATQLYIAVRICNSDLLKTCKALIPLFLFAALPVLLLVTYVPFLSEWLPSLLI